MGVVWYGGKIVVVWPGSEKSCGGGGVVEGIVVWWKELWCGGRNCGVVEK